MRLKRRTELRESSHWCCNKRDLEQIYPRQQVVKARVVQKTIPQDGSVRCGFMGMSRYSSNRTLVVSVTEYFISHEYPGISAEALTDGCPRDNIVCCNEYTFYPGSNTCLMFLQLTNILVVVRKTQMAQ